MAFITTCAPVRESVSDFGKYIGSVKTVWLDDGIKMRLLDEFTYIDPHGTRWKAPKDSIVDGASIPKFAWSFIGGPFEGRYRNASVIHDVACQEQTRKWEDVHLTFYYAMRASHVEENKAKLMYGAVYHFGPTWTVHIKEKKNRRKCSF